MNEPIPPIWTTGTTEVFKTGTWRAALALHVRAPSPCHAACPVDGDIAEWIGRARARDFRAAWEILTRHHPFPASAGRVCHHPCESACNRGGYDEPLAICRLERFVGDVAIEKGWTLAAPALERAEHIAVVGGGPSGLSAAFQLRRRGYRVTLFEAQRQLGGLMRYGIPSYRLPRSVLDAEIERIVALGIAVRCGVPLATAEDLDRLRREFDALYLATGAQRPKRLPQLDYAQPWVIDGAEYLARSNEGAPPALGRRVVVIGGGSAALDVARSARRAGCEVTILALESRAQLPAQAEEVVEAAEEGVVLIDGAMLRAAHARADHVELDCVRVRFARGARPGQFSVDPIAASAFTLAADAIVTAIGQDPELAALRPRLATDGALLKVDARQATSAERVYAGGDLASMARFVTEAVGMGKRAALAIDRMLDEASAAAARPARRAGSEGATGDSLPQAAGAEPPVPLAAINTHDYARLPRVAEARLDAAQRLAQASEVQVGLAIEQALAEAQRCFSCGTCIFCDNCVDYCPDLAVVRNDSGYAVLADYCKGCGLCVRECPTGSMKMVEESR